jgi:hypothetical protein
LIEYRTVIKKMEKIILDLKQRFNRLNPPVLNAHPAIPGYAAPNPTPWAVKQMYKNVVQVVSNYTAYWLHIKNWTRTCHAVPAMALTTKYI